MNVVASLAPDLSVFIIFICGNCLFGCCFTGLAKLQSAYKRLDLTAIADHIFFLGYGDVIFLAAIERLNARWDCLFPWGIDDGPYGQLAKT